MLQPADRRLRWEDAEDMEAESRGDLEAGQHKDVVQQAAVFRQQALFIRRGAPTRGEELELFDLSHHRGVAGHRVVVGERENVDPAQFCALQDVEIGDMGLVIIGRGRCVDMKIDTVPLRPIFITRCHGMLQVREDSPIGAHERRLCKLACNNCLTFRDRCNHVYSERRWRPPLPLQSTDALSWRSGG